MNTKVMLPLILGTTLGFLSMHTAMADDPGGNDFDRNQNWRKPEVQTRVESRADGVYIEISVRQRVPGRNGSEGPDAVRPQLISARASTVDTSSTTSAPAASNDANTSTTSAATPGRSWTDQTGYHWESPAGQVVTATPPNISSATRQSWVEQFQQHQNQNPYLIYVDQQFSGLVWVPQSSNSSNITIGPAPTNSPSPDTMVGGNGGSTDPREVALDVLGHVPLPNIQLRMNPALGLVAMPGWFWVEGYDGSPFGTSRTVNIPPEVGPEVPTSVVPANDSRRQGSSFTVDVRIWPTRYEWSFGDGATLTGLSLGKPYPAQSDIQHTYEYSSLRFPNGFPLWLTTDFAAEFRVNGGAPRGLPTIRRTYQNTYRVQEVQPVLASR